MAILNKFIENNHKIENYNHSPVDFADLIKQSLKNMINQKFQLALLFYENII